MNTAKIEELANKAGITFKQMIIEGDEYDYYHVECNDNMAEDEAGCIRNFAELIVRECVRCCEQVISDPVPQSVDTWLNGGEQCIQEIKEHFGLGMSVEDKKQLIKDLLGVQK